MSTASDKLLHRQKAPTSTTVPEVLGRWPSAPPGSCDICGDHIGSAGTHCVSAREFKGIMRKGYNPIDTGRAPRAYLLMGLSKSEAYEGWRDMVVRATTDWGLCGTCAEDVATFVVAQ